MCWPALVWVRATRFVLWTVACFAVLGLTVWAARRALRAAQPVLALICVAMFGLVVSPVSWSHHWVWALPTVLVSAVLALRLRHVSLGVVAAAGVALMVWTPITLMPEHRETAASLWRQLAGGSYIWWALAVLVVTGVVAVRDGSRHRTRRGRGAGTCRQGLTGFSRRLPRGAASTASPTPSAFPTLTSAA